MLLTSVREGAAGERRGVQRRLYEALRSAILAGALPPGARLPATRALAADSGVARQTVVVVYERLMSEGYLTGKVGAGTYVSRSIGRGDLTPAAHALHGLPPLPRGEGGQGTPRSVVLPRSTWSKQAQAATSSEGTGGRARPDFDFRPGVPDWHAFPHTTWRRLLARRWRGAGATPALAHYGDPAGYRPLREALAAYLARSRGVRCTAEQVVIVSGSQQALDLLVRVCLNAGDVAAVENPGYPPARAILAAAGVAPLLAPVDAAGLRTETLPSPGPASPRLVYVTPSHQYPTGVTLSLARRLELLAWAAEAGSLVVEDDYDSELRYVGPPLPALQGLDERGCVAYVGSCSSVLFPPLRVGWIVAPPALVAPLVAAKWLADRQTATLDQQVLADFITEGHFTAHLRRSRQLYAARRQALAVAVRRWLPDNCTLSGDAAGLQTPLLLPDGADEDAVVAAAAARSVGVEPLGPCVGTAAEYQGGARQLPAVRPGLLLGFAAMQESLIDEGVQRLSTAVKESQ